MNSTLMKQELNSSSLKEGLQFLCDKDPGLNALLKKRKGQITFFKRPSLKLMKRFIGKRALVFKKLITVLALQKHAFQEILTLIH